ncbi:ABC transporter ATP-binding protein [Rhodoferax sp.]|uniref:ABC transporter ATP-binding protein n=1 Tax=Rhodoferax sp. TaxID=50421 RepID=UPI002609A82A|nr:ABC transporter ATP-binding protein [Rhodoferax sp.]MDD2919845.1 ABC transporter ATP-binding protein [Rhodoferax sp.]
MSQAVLQVQGLGKRYRLYASPHQRLLALLGWADRSQPHWALRDVSFELQRGQCLGVVGDNGAGKSTLLKLLAGTLQPSHGQVQRIGRVTAILELGAGFHPDFTGRDNLLFGGSFIGIAREEMQRLTDDIIAFSELGEAIDRPVKTYSSGMVVRLAFALVTAVQPELLIIDEALSVGDQHFQKKCVQRIEAFRANGCTILFCSHSLYHVRQLCDKVLWLDHGQAMGLGDADAVLADYELHVRLQDQPDVPARAENPRATSALSATQAVQNCMATGRRAGLLAAAVSGLHDGASLDSAARLTEPDLVISVQAVSLSTEVPSVGVMLEQYQGVGICSVATHADGVTLTAIASEEGWTTWQVYLTFPQLPLHSGQYCLSFYLFDAQGLVVYDEWKNFIQFQWVSPSLTPGLVHLPHRWR